MELTSRTPGLLTVMLVEARVLPAARTILPALIVVGPVKVFAAKSTRLLLPYFVSAPVPEMTLVICIVIKLVRFNVPLRFTSEPTRKVGVAAERPFGAAMPTFAPAGMFMLALVTMLVPPEPVQVKRAEFDRFKEPAPLRMVLFKRNSPPARLMLPELVTLSCWN